MGYRAVDEGIVRRLAEIVGEEWVSTDPEKIKAYSYDEVHPQFWDRPYLGEVLVLPRTAQEVSRIMRLANEEMIPVVPRGAGTGLSGGCVPALGGIILSLERMNSILEIDAVNMVAVVEPGVITAEINKALSGTGLFYAGDPCSGDVSTIGGNVATNAGGNRVVKYGTTGDNVLGLEVVLPDGSILQLGGKRRKDAAGFDLVHLLVGSEGTLGVITKVILKLVPAPKGFAALLAPFGSAEEAVEMVFKISSRLGVLPSSVEFMDRRAMELASRYLQAELPGLGAEASLIVEVDGESEEALSSLYERVGELCLEGGAIDVFVAEDARTRQEVWRARKAIPEAVMHFYRFYAKEDISVPTSEVPKLIRAVEEVCAPLKLDFANFGHVGDGNVHVNVLVPDERSSWRDDLERARAELYRRVKEMGGTLTGEHGVGLKRRDYLPIFLEEPHIELLRRIKRAFDPNMILNPGKVIP